MSSFSFADNAEYFNILLEENHASVFTFDLSRISLYVEQREFATVQPDTSKKHSPQRAVPKLTVL
jgi:hypothetical protein